MVSSGRTLTNKHSKRQTSELPNDEVEAFFSRQFQLYMESSLPTVKENEAYPQHYFNFLYNDYWTWNPFDKGSEINCTDDFKRVQFHPNISNGTSGIRGTRALEDRKYFWEVETVFRNIGTSTMFGVSTKALQLTDYSYGHLLGKDNQSWGLSSNGEIYHNGIAREYCKPFDICKITRIGVLFDGDAGTLSFYKNGKNLGIAFDNLKTASQALYPTVCSTSARTEMKLTVCKKQNLSLKECCRDVVINQLNDMSSLVELHLPKYLERYLEGELELKVARGPSSEPMDCWD